MPRNYVGFGDIEGKLDVLRVECTRCSRRGVYYLHRLIEKHGRKGNMNEMEGAAQRRLSEARRTQPARTLRLDMPRSAEGALIRRRPPFI